MDARLQAVPVVPALARALEGVAAGLYVGGSVATGDYRPGVSDVDAVALLDRAPSPATRAHLVDVHRRLVREVDGGSALHCVYVPADQAADVGRRHWTWAFEELFRRPLSGVARAELLADPVVVTGPEPAAWLPPMAADDLRDAARAELAGYWTRALRRRAIWLEDVYVDLGLTVWARADATINRGVLITKREAIELLAASGLPAYVVDGVARRRRGEQVALSEAQRQDRAALVRAFLRARVDELLGTEGPG
jgi:Nucleotidyltransferase domain